MRLTVILACAASVTGHGMIISPKSRNANDAAKLGAGMCNSYVDYNPPYTNTSVAERVGGSGQPCLWFSQGCTIGCEKCDNHTQHTNGHSLCGADSMEPTNNDPMTRTMNRDAVAGGVNDSYRYNPWRAPGFAPVSDACGIAGGRHRTDPGGGDAVFTSIPSIAPNGPIALGAAGTQVLMKGPSFATWTAGATVEVKWGIRFNHGGGYQFRLCKASEALSEACFQKTPLPFSGNPVLRWNNGSEFAMNGTFVSEGTSPAGSTWQMNPIPRIDYDSTSSGQPKGFKGCTHITGLACRQFDPPCHEQTWGNGMPWHGTNSAKSTNNNDVQGDCSGDLTAAAIVDHVVLPSSLPAGDYVLGFRWDCEETAQIWSSCSDVTIKAAESVE